VSAAAVIAAAGCGRRFASGQAPPDRVLAPKTYVPFGAEPLLCASLRAFDRHPQIAPIVIVAAPDALELAEAAIACASPQTPSLVVGGGATRQDSVRHGLAALAPDPPDLVLIHDAARPLLSQRLLSRCLAQCRERGSAVAALPVTDTIREAADDLRVLRTLDRTSLWRMQTPQAFRFADIWDAHQRAQAAGVQFTDDAGLIEWAGGEVLLTEGEAANVKVTTPEDLAWAEVLCGVARGAMRVGCGFDAHRLAPDRRLVLGGVTIEHETGLLGHSDADVLTHAVLDACLGAAALGDLGRHFPDSDPQYRDISSLTLAERAAALLRQRGYRVANVDATVIAEQPRIAPHAEQMRANVAAALGCPVDAVSVKATTTEGLGPWGRGEGIAAQAVVTLAPLPRANEAD